MIPSLWIIFQKKSISLFMKKANCKFSKFTKFSPKTPHQNPKPYPSGSNHQTHKINLRKLLLRNFDFFLQFTFRGFVICGRPIFRMQHQHFSNTGVTMILNFSFPTIFSGIKSFSGLIVNGFRGWGSVSRVFWNPVIAGT